MMYKKKYLLDSNVFILAFSGHESNGRVLRNVVRNGELLISVINSAEIMVKADDFEKKSFLQLASSFPILEIDQDIALLAADIRSHSLKSKKRFLADCFIAATAIKHDLTFISNDKDFKYIKELQFEGVED